jgi:hypothetical protein
MLTFRGNVPHCGLESAAEATPRAFLYFVVRRSKSDPNY